MFGDCKGETAQWDGVGIGWGTGYHGNSAMGWE